VTDAAETAETERKKKHVILKFPLSYVLINKPGSGAPDTAELEKIAAAITKGMNGPFADEYNLGATVRYDTSASPGEIPCFLQPTLEEDGALGYHNWPPVIYVSPLLNAQDGSALSSCIDHEVKEATLDLTIDQATSGMDGHFWAKEPCDAVEQDTFTIDGVPLSNFVTGDWYSGRSSKYDYLGKLTKPLSLTAGGYAQYFDPKKGWQQIVHEEKGPRSYRVRANSRSAVRKSRAKFHTESGLWTL
jgi:hypothetical protein